MKDYVMLGFYFHLISLKEISLSLTGKLLTAYHLSSKKDPTPVTLTYHDFFLF